MRRPAPLPATGALPDPFPSWHTACARSLWCRVGVRWGLVVGFTLAERVDVRPPDAPDAHGKEPS